MSESGSSLVWPSPAAAGFLCSMRGPHISKNSNCNSDPDFHCLRSYCPPLQLHRVRGEHFAQQGSCREVLGGHGAQWTWHSSDTLLLQGLEAMTPGFNQPARRSADRRPNTTELPPPCVWTYMVSGQKPTVRHHGKVQGGRGSGWKS